MADMTTTATVVTKINGEQAENELKKLQGEAKELRVAIAKAFTEGNTKLQKQLEKSLRNVESEARKLKASMFDLNKVLSNLNTASVKDLNKALRMLTTELNSGKIARGSKEWNEHIKQIKALKGELASVAAQQRATTSGWQRMVEGFNKYGAAAASAVAAITGVTFAINQMNAKAREKEDSAANLKALTGLDDNSIQWLTDQATALSTNMQENGVRIRKSATEILEAYKLVGSAKPQLLQNKEALNDVTIQTMTLAEAAGISLTEAVDGVTLALNQFKAEAEEAARFSNVMAAGAQAGSAEVASVTAALRKSGVVMAQSNVTIEETVGLIETLAEFGIKDEIAGTGMKTFFLKLAGGADETNPKIVGVTKALENLAKQNLSAAEIQKRFGLEAYNVASILIQNTEKINHYTKAVTDTNQAVEQAAVNSATAQAKMSQMKNELQEAGIVIAQELSPYMIRLGNTFTNTVKVLTAVIKLIKEYGAVLVSTGTALAAYTVIAKGATIANKALDFWNDKLSKSFASIGRAIKANPWGVAITAITAIVTLTGKWVKNHDKLSRTMSDMNSQLLMEKKNLDNLFTPLKKSNTSSAERTLLLKKINDQYGEYLPNLLNEKSSIEEINKAYDSLLSNMREKVIIETKETAIADATQKMVKGQAKQIEDLRKALVSAYGKDSPLIDDWVTKVVTGIEGSDNPYNKAKQLIAEIFSDITHNQKGKSLWDIMNPIDNLQMQGSIENYARLTAEAARQIADINKNFDPLMPSGGTTTPSQSITGAPSAATSSTSLIEDTFQKQLDVIKANLTKRTNVLRESRNNDLITEEDFNAAVTALNIEAMQEQLNLIRNKYGEDSLEYQNALAKFLDIQEDFNKLSEKCDDDANKTKKQKEEELQKQLSALRKKYGIEDNNALMNAELAQLDMLHSQKLLKEREYQQLRKAIIDKYAAVDKSGNLFPNGIFGGEDNQQQILNAAFKAFNDVTSGISDLFNAQQAEEMAAIDKKYAHEIELAGDNQGKITAIEKKKEAEKARVQSQYADRQFGIQIAQALSSAAMSIIQCFAQLGPIAGAISAVAVGATTGLQIAAMNKQRQAAKQYWTGGFTPDGPWNEYQGNVHSSEFVANRHAVRNPNVRRVLNVIDAAQRNNTIASMTQQEVSDSLNASGVTTATAVGNLTMGADNDALAKVTAQLAAVLARGIVANVSIEGPNGFEETYNRYLSNKENKTF